MIDNPESLLAEAALAAWEAEALQELTLPSGTRVRVVPGSLVELMVRGLFPEPLMESFLDSREGRAAKKDDEPTGQEARDGLELMRRAQEIGAESVKQIWHADAWQPVTLDVARFGRLPIDDQVAIRKVALGDDQLAEVGLPGLAAFRDGPPGAGAGDDGKDVRGPAVKPARPNRAARRARPRPDPRR